MIKIKLNNSGFSILQVLVSLGLLGGVMMTMMKFDFLQMKNSRDIKLFREGVMARNFIEEYMSIPGFCGSFLNTLSSAELRSNGEVIMPTINNAVFKNMDFNQSDDSFVIRRAKINRVDATAIPPGEKGLRLYTINFEFTKKNIIDGTETRRSIYNEEREIQFFIHNDTGGAPNYILERCHLEGSKVVAMQQVLCEEVGGTYRDYLCLFGDNETPFVESLCEIERIVVEIEKAGSDDICVGGVLNCADPNDVLIPGVPQQLDAQTTYCPEIE